MSSTLSYQIIDAFTSEPFSGNPASVILFPKGHPRTNDEKWCLKVAGEFNLSETAFLEPLEDEEDEACYRLRWFTPTVEFPLCGHATLASAHVLLNGIHSSSSSVAFKTLSGTLKARRVGAKIELDFPADVSVLDRQQIRNEDLKTVQEYLGKMGFKRGDWVQIARGRLAWIIEVASVVDLPNLTLDVKEFKSLEGYVVFTQVAPSSAAEDIWSRVLDPVERDQEDPVTGSAHCMLAPYWFGDVSANVRLRSMKNHLETGASVFHAKQVSKRGGHLEVEWKRDQGRILLRGDAVKVMEGELRA